MPTLLDLVWKPSNEQPNYPGDDPTIAPAIYRGDDYTIHLVLLDGATPWVPEGELTAQLRKARLGAGATVSDPVADFEITVGGVDGNEVTCHLTNADAKRAPDQAYWDLQETFVDGTTRTWFTGKANAWGDVTREAVGS